MMTLNFIMIMIMTKDKDKGKDELLLGTVPNEKKTYSKVFRNQAQTGLICSSAIKKEDIKAIGGKNRT